jgi:hypothetical protein
MQNIATKKRKLPMWFTLKCDEVIVKSPASLYAISLAQCIDNNKEDGTSQLEVFQHIYHKLPKVILNIVYTENCSVLNCFNNFTSPYGLHRHTETSHHYKFFSTKTRNCRKHIKHVFAENIETTINKSELKNNVYVGKQLSVKRRLFE